MHTFLIMRQATSLAAMLMPWMATAAANPNTMSLTPAFFPEYSAQRVHIHYGPFTVPGNMIENGMKDFLIMSAQKPCSDCLITWMHAGLEYPNGREANANTKLWLHHTVFSNMGANSLVCPMAGRVENFFASGNERTPVDICANGTAKVGYHLSSDADIVMMVELMNMDDQPQEAVLTMTYEFIPSVPAEFAKARVLWLDIGGCTGSSEFPAKKDSVFQYSSPAWKSQSAGRITFIAGHLHDGGTHLEVFKNKHLICDSEAAYGQSPGYVDPGMETGMPGMGGMLHISSLSACTNEGTIAPGDEMAITAYYNTSKWAPMMNADGSLEPIMGISLVYLAESTRGGDTGSEAAACVQSTATASMSTPVSTRGATHTANESAQDFLGIRWLAEVLLGGVGVFF